MLKNIFYPTLQNAFVWISALYLFILLFIGIADAMVIVFAYFLETIIIGVFNVLKLFLTIRFSKKENKNPDMGISGFGLIFFFMFHYGFFVAIQSIFGFSLFSFGDNGLIKEPFYIFDNYAIILNLEGIKYALPAIIFMHFGKFIFDFLKNKKYLKFSSDDIMIKPYVRVFIQQFVVIIAFFFMVFDEAGIIAAFLLITFRLIIDLILEAIKENSKTLDYLSEKLANEKASKEDVKKQLINFTE
ncbi:DUF6498-containing protein [Polaribacter uvawellassae]|uniref:DUF6498-containing protein n=1 Tax=Polaribacter uvawellassae TaxID=3133495 RepID=UPI003219B126